MAVAKIWNGSAWVRAIVGAKGDKGDPGIVIDEGSGAADGDILVYDASADAWVPQPPEQPGKIISVSSVTKSDTQTMSSVSAGASVAVSGLSVTITPKNSLSKFLVTGFVMASAGHSPTTVGLDLRRNGISIGAGATTTDAVEVHSAVSEVHANFEIGSMPINFLDSPATSSSVTYSVNLFNLNYDGLSDTILVNATMEDDDDPNFPRPVSVLTVMEISG